MIWACILTAIIAYLLGSISFSIIFTKKIAGFDVRKKEVEMLEAQMCLEQLEKNQQF